MLPVDADSAFDLAVTLDVALASELGDFLVEGDPVVMQKWSEVPGVDRALQRAGVEEVPTARVLSYQRLFVVDVEGQRVDVPWRAMGSDDHVRAGDTAALGRALAWRTGLWQERATMAEALRAGGDPGAGALLDAEDTL